MKWFVIEISIEETDGEFGPFDTLDEALEFTKDNKYPWSEQFISKIVIEKRNSDEVLPTTDNTATNMAITNLPPRNVIGDFL